MSNSSEKLRREIETIQASLKQKQDELVRIERNCSHVWGTVQTDHKHIKGGWVEGDPPGTMGVDRRLGFYSPSYTIKKWNRTCTICGKVQTTNKTKTKAVSVLHEGVNCVGTAEVPDFGDR